MYLSFIKTSLLGLVPMLLSAQNYVSESRLYTTIDGLSHNSVSHIYEDSRGLIWLSTRYGLNRFDGENFRSYTSQEYGFQSSVASQTYEDADGLLWVLNGKGGFFNPAYGEAVTFDLFDPISERVLPSTEVLSPALIDGIIDCEHYLQLPDKSILFLDEAGWIIRYKGNNQYEKHPFHSVGEIHAIKLLGDSQLALFKHYSSADAQNGVQIISTSGVTIKALEDIRNGGYIGAGRFAVSTTDPTQIWINYPYHGQILFAQLLPNGEWAKSSAYDFLPEGVENANWCLQFIDNERGHYWFGAGEELWVVDDQRNLINRFNKVDGSRFMLRTTSGKYFAINQSSGLYSIDLIASKFQTINIDKHSVRGICISDNNHLWVGSEGNHLWLDDKLETDTRSHFIASISAFKNEEGFIFTGPDMREKTRNTSNVFASYYPPNATSLLDRQDIVIDTTLDSYVWAIWQDPTTMNLWRADQSRNIHIYDLKQACFSKIEIPATYSDINEALIYYFFQDSDNHLWLCSSNGLYELNEEREFIARYWSKADDDQFLPASDFHHMYEDTEGVFWIASGNSGLIKWDRSKHEKHNYSRLDGLPSNVIHAVYPDAYNGLWLSTESGIARFHKHSEFIEKYSLHDGISDMEFNRVSHFQDKNDYIYFGGLNGITIIDPKLFNQEVIPLESIHLFPIDLKVRNNRNGHTYCGLSVFKDKGRIAMDRYSNRLEIQFLGNQLKQKGVFIESQIINYQDEPNLLHSNRLNIENIPFGSYTLELTARHTNGEIIERISIPIDHPSPVHLQKWFLGLVLAFIILSVGYFVKYRTKRLTLKNILLEKEVVQRTQQIETDRAIIQKQAEELLEIDRLKSRFLANISHELRTPISLIAGPINQILQDQNLSDQNRIKLANVQRHSNNILTLVNDLFDLTKISAGKLKIDRSSFQLASTLNTIWSDYQHHAIQKNIEFKLEQHIDDQTWAISDQRKVETVLKNLLSNALKHTPVGGCITFKADIKESFITLEVSDNGPGIPAEEADRIFDRFYRIMSPQHSAVHGTGIGLAICKEFANLINGQVSVASKDGQGSLFIFKFPFERGNPTLTKLQADLTTNPASRQHTTTSSKRLNDHTTSILVVEDNYELRNYLKEILGAKFRVTPATNGLEALTYLEQRSTFDKLPELIVTDLSMPTMGGFELIERLKESKVFSLIPTIVVSAMSNLDDRMRALRLGVDDYVLKPFAEEELIQRIQNLLQNAKVRSSAIQRTAEILSKGAENQNILTKDEAACLTINSEVAKDWLPLVEKAAIELIADPANGVEELAKAVFVSKRTLSRKLKFHTGMPPNKYLLEIRLQQARILLEQSEPLSIKEIAFKVGIQKTSYFSKRFKERFGCSPVNYSNSIVNTI